MPRACKEIKFVIASGASLSGGVSIAALINASLEIVTDFTSAAAITFQGADSLAGTYYNIYDANGTEVTIPSHATHTGRSYELPAAVMNHKFIKVRSGTSGAAQTQTPTSGDTTLKIVAKD